MTPLRSLFEPRGANPEVAHRPGRGRGRAADQRQIDRGHLGLLVGTAVQRRGGACDLHPVPGLGNQFLLCVSVVARALDLPVATLRSWNQRYGLGPTPRRPGEHRYYSTDDVVAVRRMAELVRAGIGPRNAAKAARAAHTAAYVPASGTPLLAAADRLDTSELLDTIAAHTAQFGVVATWNRLCRPAFTELVARQHRGHGLVDVEHALSWAVTAALHRAVPPARDTGALVPVVLACTGGEGHVLPLEVLRAALTETGIPAVLLGASVPGSALADAVSRQSRAPVVVLWSQTRRTAAPHPLPAGGRETAQLLLAGPGWTAVTAPAGALRVASLDDALHLIGRIVRPGREHR